MTPEAVRHAPGPIRWGILGNGPRLRCQYICATLPAWNCPVFISPLLQVARPGSRPVGHPILFHAAVCLLR